MVSLFHFYILYAILPPIKKPLKFNLNRLLSLPGEAETIFIFLTNNTVAGVHYAHNKKRSLLLLLVREESTLKYLIIQMSGPASSCPAL